MCDRCQTETPRNGRWFTISGFTESLDTESLDRFICYQNRLQPVHCENLNVNTNNGQTVIACGVDQDNLDDVMGQEC